MIKPGMEIQLWFRRVQVPPPAVSQSALSSNGHENWYVQVPSHFCNALYRRPTPSTAAENISFLAGSLPVSPTLDKIPKFRIFSTAIMRLQVFTSNFPSPCLFLRTGKFVRALMAIQRRVHFLQARKKQSGGLNLQNSMVDSVPSPLCR